jgi:thiol-disulfide isomerase/thioredoxin
LTDIPVADFTIVEYWAGWCEPCKMEAKELADVLAAHPDVAINVLHTEADPQKVLGAKIVKKP